MSAEFITQAAMVQSLLYVAFYFLINALCKPIFLKIKMLYMLVEFCMPQQIDFYSIMLRYIPIIC